MNKVAGVLGKAQKTGHKGGRGKNWSELDGFGLGRLTKKFA